MTPPGTPDTPPLSPTDPIAFAIHKAIANAHIVQSSTHRGLANDECARQVLRAAEVDLRRLPHALEKYRLGNTLELHDIAACYGVTLHG